MRYKTVARPCVLLGKPH